MKKYILLAIMAIVLAWVVIGDPSVVDLTEGLSSRGNSTLLSNVTAVAGNTTYLGIDQNIITGIWQGFFGKSAREILGVGKE